MFVSVNMLKKVVGGDNVVFLCFFVLVDLLKLSVHSMWDVAYGQVIIDGWKWKVRYCLGK